MQTNEQESPFSYDRLLLFLVIAFAWAESLSAQTWEIVYPEYGAENIACSADASIIYTRASEEVLSVSTNEGETWTNLPPIANYQMVCSGDGQKLATFQYGGGSILISTNGGASATTVDIYTLGAAWSASGNTLAVVGQGLSITTNNGTTWISPPALKTNDLSLVALSEDGSVIAVVGQRLFLSTNSGRSCSAVGPETNLLWTALACTADGTKIIGATSTGPTEVVTSLDSGKTWTSHPPPGFHLSTPPFYRFASLASSFDGSLVVGAIVTGGPYEILLSRDFGLSWILESASTDFPPACSSDGTVIVANLNFEIGIQTLPPPLNIIPAPNQLTLSWPAPSSQYALQQVSDLSDTNWLGVTNAITVTNYRNQVILAPPATGNAFYRLQGPNP
jgi:hypothetical protein